jgi:uncharacterized protein involved in exopolysaccharide biosynthesis
MSSRLASLCGAVRRQRLVFVSVLALTVLKVYVAQTVIPEMYEARAAIVVPVGQNIPEQHASDIQILRSRQLLGDVVDAVGPHTFNLPAGHTDRLFDHVKLAAHRGVAQIHALYTEALIALDLAERLSAREQALAKLERHLQVESQQSEGVIVLRLQMSDAALAVKTQQTLLDRFQTRRAQVHQQSRPSATSERETERLRENLTRAEEELTRAQQTATLAGRATNGTDASASLLAELEERRRRIEQNYLTALKRQNAAGTRQTLDSGSVTILTAPTASLEPVYPRKLLVMAMAVALGLVLGLATATVREWTNNSVRDELTLERATRLVCFGSFVDRRT